MAVAAPEPKKPEERRHAKKPARGEWQDLEPLAKPVLSALPARQPDGEPWNPMAKAAWEAWRADPVSRTWGKADIDYALDTLLLYWKFERNAAEIRLRWDTLGMTPKGRRDLRLRLPQETASEVRSEANRQRRKTRGKRRATLSVVDGASG